jgi:penicillin-binding protein 2
VKGKIILSTSGGSSTSANGTNESVSYNYSNFEDNKFSFSQFLQHAIASNNIDLTKLNISDQYYNTEEIYEKLLEVLIDTLKNDSKFDKILYKSLVYSYKLSGTEICLLLFDQGVIKYNKEEKSNLENGVISAYSFITDKIRTLEITPAQLALDPCSASVVVTDVKTGEVLAMVSYPSYDNNMFANKVDAAYFNKLNNDLTGPQNHRATKQRTAPGSTFKMVSAAALLEEGAVGPSETILDKTIFDKIVPSPRDWTTHSHGKVDVTTALEVSCNYFFYEGSWRLGMDSTGKNNDQIGLEKLAKYAELFGFGEKSGIEVEEYDPHISDKYSVPSAIGQGTHNYTPVQIARYVTTVANSGKRFDLTLLDRIQDKDNNVLLDNKAKYTELTTIKDSTWDLIHEGMYKVGNGARSSTSKMFKDFGVTVAGKTGTAQESKSKPNHALFVSYAPYTAPEISVTTVIPNGHGSSNAVELTRDVYSYYFDLEDKDKLVNGFAELPETESRGFAD